MGQREIHKKIFVEFFIAFLWLLGIVFLLPKALGFFMPFVIGWVISMIANPFIRLLEKKVNIKRKHSSVIITVAILAAVVLVIYGAVSITARQVVSFVRDLPIMVEEVQARLDLAAKSMQGLYDILPDNMEDSFNNAGAAILETITHFLSKISTSSLDGAGSLVKNVAEFFFMAIITILSAYFFIVDREKLIKLAGKAMPEAVAEKVQLIKENFAKALGGYFKAQLKIMVIITGILFVGFFMIDVKYAFLLSMGVAFLDFLPIFGTGTVLFPWALIELASGNYYRVICLLIIYLICQLARQLLQPKMVGDSVGLSPLTALFFMFVGYQAKGLIGMIVGIPLGMALISFYHAGAFDSLIRGAKILIHDIGEYKKY